MIGAAFNRSKPKLPKLRKCAVKACRTPFTPFSSLVKWCSAECGTVLAMLALDKKKAKEQREKNKLARADRVETKRKLEQHKPLGYWERKAEVACNTYIRARDPDECISCGVTQSSAWQAGHYIAVGANSTLRYHEDNIHKQCIQCNLFKGSNAIAYRLRLIEKIGLERVDWLESWHPPIKMTREAAQEIEALYKAKLKEIQKVKS